MDDDFNVDAHEKILEVLHIYTDGCEEGINVLTNCLLDLISWLHIDDTTTKIPVETLEVLFDKIVDDYPKFLMWQHIRQSKKQLHH